MKAVVVGVVGGWLVLGALAGNTNLTAIAPAPVRFQTMCPIMNEKIDRALSVDFEGKRIYVCCKGCVGEVTKDPGKYLRQLEAAGITPAKLQTDCPVMGGKIDKKVFVDRHGLRIYFCCAGCIAKFKAEPDKYLKLMEAQGIAPDATPARDKDAQ